MRSSVTEIVPTINKCVGSRSGRIVCVHSEDYKAKNRLKLSSCLWSHMVLKSVKVLKSSSVCLTS